MRIAGDFFLNFDIFKKYIHVVPIKCDKKLSKRFAKTKINICNIFYYYYCYNPFHCIFIYIY